MTTGILDESSSRLAEELPVDNQELALEKRMAKFAKTADFRLLKEHLEARIEFYQSYLPDGRPVNVEVPTPEQWAIANAIIGEFNNVIKSFETAAEAVHEAARS